MAQVSDLGYDASMIKQTSRILVLVVFSVLSLGASQCSKSSWPNLSSDERLIVLLQTNDIHGGVESYINSDGHRSGGMAILGGIVRAIREGVEKNFGPTAGVLVLDAGDQFQGTLLSNFSEGQLVFDNMNEIGYDAVVPGNHDYDFGPIGWLDDRVTPVTPDQNPRGALERLAHHAKFPLLSANTFIKKSLVDLEGHSVEVDGIGCKPVSKKMVVDFSRAVSPSFLRSYVIKDVAGVRVALIGLDNPNTPTVTTGVNVEDLCFADPAAIFLQVRKSLGDQADVFVAIIHDGNSEFGRGATQFVEKVGDQVDAVISGHTHFVSKTLVNGIPIVQSGANGKMFGRVDLVFDRAQKKVDKSRTRVNGGIQMIYDLCAPAAKEFCEVNSASRGATVPVYEGVAALPNSQIELQISNANSQLETVAGRKLGVVVNNLPGNRIAESPLADAITDWMRLATGAQIAMVNTGGLRAEIKKGELTYGSLFQVLPFNNRGILLDPMPFGKILKLLEHSVKTCGAHGALMQSGLKVTFERNCEPGKEVDSAAKVLHVETLAGDVLLDVRGGVTPDLNKTFSVATLDFLVDGGAGYEDFKGSPVKADLGIVRELIVDYLTDNLKGEGRFTGEIDGRFKEVSRDKL